jgi:hypothetical protein
LVQKDSGVTTPVSTVPVSEVSVVSVVSDVSAVSTTVAVSSVVSTVSSLVEVYFPEEHAAPTINTNTEEMEKREIMDILLSNIE